MTRSIAFLAGRAAAIGALMAGVLVCGATAQAQDGPAVVVMLDGNVIGPNAPLNAFSAPDVNVPIATLGLRDVLPFFLRSVDQQVELPVGAPDHAGWFALSAVPPSWASASSSGDPLADFVTAGAGLGSPDESNDRGSLLDNVPGVLPLTAANVQALAGRTVCGIVFAGEIIPGPEATSLRGANLGIVGFTVGALNDAGTAVTVQVTDAISACSARGTAPQ